jgi:RNA polymerase sigma-70 factor (ECF subfamily)
MGEHRSVEQEIIVGLQADDPGALETLFRAHYSSLCSYASGMVGSGGEDIVQDVFANLWQSRRRLEVHTSLRAYLYRSVRNRVLNELRTRAAARAAAGRSAIMSSPDAGPDPLDIAIAAESAAVLRSAIANLPPRCRQVIELRWRHQLSHAEIAETLGITRKGVEVQITRGLRALRDALSG